MKILDSETFHTSNRNAAASAVLDWGLLQKQRVLTEAWNSSELPLMKELTILRRARSLRDPSTSPAWSNSSYGSRRLQGNINRDEAREMKGVDGNIRREGRKAGSKREKLDLRPGGRHWVGEFLGDDAADVQVMSCPGSDYKENHGLKTTKLTDRYQGILAKGKAKSSKAIGKKGRRLDKSKSYPRVGHAEEDEHSNDSQRGPISATNHHVERHETTKGSILMERIADEDERLQRDSVREAENSWIGDPPERRAEIARRVISETSKGDGLRVDSLDMGLPSRMFTQRVSEASARARQNHFDLLSVMNSTKQHAERDEPESFCGSDEEGEEQEVEEEEAQEDDEEDEEEEEISLTNGLKQVPSSLSSHIHSPLLYRDSMTIAINEESAQRGRRSGKMPGHRDGERRRREGISLRVAGKPQGRLRGRRASLRPGLSSVSNGGSASGMEGELEVSELPRNGCGIPWYWSKMHKYRGKRFLDIAGRSLGCAFTEGTKTKDELNSDIKQCRSNSHGELMQCGHHTLSLGNDFERRSSDCEESGQLFEVHEGEGSPEIPRADGNLLTADHSGELIFGSTRQDLSGVLVATSPALGDQSPGPAPAPSIHATSEEPNHSLSQKYRPRSFNEIVGQSMVTKSLGTAVMKGKIAPLYLFQGPRGTGKSSAARIFAQALNCVSDDNAIPKPCGLCTQCTKPSPDVIECDATSYLGMDSVKALMGSMHSAPTSRWRVFIIDDCHCLPAEAWSTFLKSLDKAPWQVVFILITTDGEKVPCTAVSRCQKFLFSKIKEADIVNRLRSLASMEGLEVESSALSLVAGRSQGSLRDAETILDQLSLLGKKVSKSMVQEMVGLVPDEKLIELLDLAMSAEAVSTVRCMRDLLDDGLEPLALVSQLATLITDILAGTYVVTREKLSKGFFFRRSSKKEEAVRLRQALKILSEVEKQLRVSSDQPTWLTAALLQFAPDRSFLPSSLETSVVASPVAAFNDNSEKETGDSLQPWTSDDLIQSKAENGNGEVMAGKVQRLSSNYRDKRKKKNIASSHAEAKIHPAGSPVIGRLSISEDKMSGRPSNARSDTPLLSGSNDDQNQRDFTVVSHRKLEEVWQRVLNGSRSNVLRQLLQGQGKLLSLNLSDAYAVAHIEFRHPEHKARAERARSRICNAFQMALGCPVELQISLACMAGEQLSGSTTFDNHGQQFDDLNSEMAKVIIATPDRRSYEVKASVQNRRRQRGTRVQRHTESMDISQSLYNAVMGDSNSEILPAANSTRWGRHGEEDLSDRSRKTRTYSIPVPQDVRQMDNARMRYAPTFASRITSGRVPLRTAIHQFDDPSPNEDLAADATCGSSSRRKSVTFSDVNTGNTANLGRESLRLESLPNASPMESRLLCWRVQKKDEEKTRLQRRRRQRRVKLFLRIVPCAKTRPRAQQH